MQKIVGVKHDTSKNICYFLENISVELGDKVVVSIDDFQTIATVTKVGTEVEDAKAKEFAKIIRKATESDISKYESLKKKASSDLPKIKKKSLELGLMMKFVSAEYSLDNQKILITFSSEERVDFRQFLKELASMFKLRIELKQIGQRDELKILGGVGPCGEPCCCGRFLKDFNHVTVKMAKIQGLSLSPTKINGVCGRLMCCLGYESKVYEEVLSRMPKINSEVKAPNGVGIVVYNDILRERVSVKRQSEGDSYIVEDFALDEIEFEGKKIAENKSSAKSNEKNQLEKPSEENKKDEFAQKNTEKLKENQKKYNENKGYNKNKNSNYNKNSTEKDEKSKPEEIILGQPQKEDKNFEENSQKNKSSNSSKNGANNKIKSYNTNKRKKFNKK